MKKSNKATGYSVIPQIAIRLVVVFLALLSYGNSSWGQFVFDDSEAILGNQDVDPWSSSLQQVFSNDFWGERVSSNVSHKSYRPLTILTFRWNYWLAGGLEPFGFHLANVVLHAVVSLLYLEICTAICQRANLDCSGAYGITPAVAALLFAVHPVHTESVSTVGDQTLWDQKVLHTAVFKCLGSNTRIHVTRFWMMCACRLLELWAGLK